MMRSSSFASTRRRSFASLSATLLAACLGGPALAQSTTAESGALRGHGLKMDWDAGWPGGNGYRPVRVTFAPIKATTLDRILTVELVVLPYDFASYPGAGEDRLLQFEQDVEVPAGAKSVSMTLSVPEHGRWQHYRLAVYEEGNRLSRLCTPTTSPSLWYGNTYQGLVDLLPNVLIVGASTPPTERLADALPMDEFHYALTYNNTPPTS